MSIATKMQTTIIVLKTQNAIDWINENISLSSKQYNKDDDTGHLTIEIDSRFVGELIESMEDDLADSDFLVNE